MKKIIKFLLILMVCSVLLFPLAASGNSETSNSTTSTTTTVTTTVNDTTEESITDSANISVHKMEISIDDADWAALLAAPVDEEWYSADATYDGETASDVAFRTKGNSTLTSVANSDSERYSFKIKTDKYEDDQTINDMNEIVLNSCYADASYLREYLTYQASEDLGLITPETEFTELYINGELYGLYLYVESYDDTFMAENTTTDTAVLYKADGENCSLTEADTLDGFEVKEGDDDNFDNLKALQTALNSGDYDQIESVLDTDSVLKWAALSYFTGNYDSYLGSKAHNYYLIYDSGQFEMVGWDYNMSFGTFPQDNGNSLKLTTDNIFMDTTAEERPLVSVLLENDEYQAKFDSYVEQLENWFAPYESAISKMSSTLYSYVENDPTAFFTIDEFTENTTASDLTLDDIQTSSMSSERMQPPMGDEELTDEQMSNLPPMGDQQMGNLPPMGGQRGPQAGQADDNMMQGPGQGIGNNQNSSISIVDFIRLRLAGLK